MPLSSWFCTFLYQMLRDMIWLRVFLCEAHRPLSMVTRRYPLSCISLRYVSERKCYDQGPKQDSDKTRREVYLSTNRTAIAPELGL